MDQCANPSVTHRTSTHPQPSVEGEASSLLHQTGHDGHRGFDILVNRYKNRLFAYIVYRVSDRHRAEDLTQEVFLRAFRAAARGRPLQPDGTGAWLFTIARNCVIEFLRSRGRKPLRLETDLAADEQFPSRGSRPSEGVDPAEKAQQADERQRIEGLLARLPEGQREVLVLRVFGGLTVAEIAESTGCSLGTVKSRMRYGLLKIRRMIDPSTGVRP
jgi:RNA polymerase sigma factor (sigma-70 family)